MKTYKLLTFNEDYADEHCVPALAVMTEDQYNFWCNTPSGKLNSEYEKQKAKYDANEKYSSDFWKALKDAGVVYTDKIPADRLDLIKLEKDYRKNYSYMRGPNKVRSFISANLGNGGEGFEESYSDYYLFEELVTAGKVHVMDVSEEFAETFKKARLEDLSLCNVFDLDSISEYDEDNYNLDDDDE